ncbi:MAG: undecaprenyldiphospho-muramoylpentapeptide beta-N-acetylglucosaminyltransferase [Prochloraceae cyanobacterium]|nr:undecaprenyldiphospho-muramoylpentapeptide beta-N-acetylglucosaminyltransferase [Prochloraceae cyanobacterium]
MSQKSTKLLIAASGTGGHLFPAIALAEQLPEYTIEWLGVKDRLEQKSIADRYPLHAIDIEGFQQGLSLKTFSILGKILASVFRVRQLIKELEINAVFTTGGYIAAPAILAARLQNIPVILHESNFLPGKVTRVFSSLCDAVAVGFEGSTQYLPRARTVHVSTPVRSEFLAPRSLDLPLSEDAFVIVVVGGSQGAVAINQLVRDCAAAWLSEGAAIVHLTGDRDPDANTFFAPNYFALPFYDNMAGLFQRADLAISRAGAGTLTELAITNTPAILIPYPFAAEDHQSFNAKVFQSAGGAIVFQQKELSSTILKTKVLELMSSKSQLEEMAANLENLAVKDSAERLATLVREAIAAKSK